VYFGMAARMIANLNDACERFAAHKTLKKISDAWYVRLSKSDVKFIGDWVSAETWSGSSKKWGRLTSVQRQALIQKEWNRVFAKAPPRLLKPTTMYRAVTGEHARLLASMKAGATVDINRYSSFAHSPDMVRKYAAFLCEPGEKCAIVIMCVAVPKGHPFVFLGGFEHAAVQSAFLDGSVNIDRTQGEVVLAPGIWKKLGRNRNVDFCTPDGTVVTLAIVSLTAVAPSRT
jgi:hypothetical protein